MLHIRISILKSYLESVKAGKLPADQSLLRDINSVCQQLPAIESGEFNEAFFTVCHCFIPLFSFYLEMMTQCCTGFLTAYKLRDLICLSIANLLFHSFVLFSLLGIQ
jgi:hypothetical protein